MDAFKPFSRKSPPAQSLTRAEAEAAFDAAALGRGRPSADGRLSDGPCACAARRSTKSPARSPPCGRKCCGSSRRRRDRHRRHRRRRPGTYNVSTLAAMIVAACGVPVAKHGNRAASSRSGASDVLGALGVQHRPRAGRRSSAACSEAGIGFMTAPGPSCRDAPCRAGAGANSARAPCSTCSGRSSNPAGVKRQLLGVFAEAGWSRWRRRCAISAPSASGSSMAPTGSTKSTTTGPT